MENDKIRRMAKGYGVPLWKVCDRLEISEPTLTRLLRRPLTKEKESEIISIINELSEGVE